MKKQVVHRPTWTIAIYRLHRSGIGSILVRRVESTVRPTWDNCDFFDVTNGWWSRWEGGKHDLQSR